VIQQTGKDIKMEIIDSKKAILNSCKEVELEYE
jgi:hypothetical protein